jgi:hypothetical protein
LKFALITALDNADLEDRIISALSPHGFFLIQRCYSQETLAAVLLSLNHEVRTLVILTNDYLENRELTNSTSAENISFLEISPYSHLSTEEIYSRAMEALRKPESGIQTRTMRKKQPNWLTFTGTPSAPGISTLALNVAAELSLKRPITLIDTDSNRKDQHFMLGLKYESRVKISPNLSLINVDSEVNSAELNNINPHVNCFDLGATARLSSLATDRRSSGRRFLDVISQSTHIIYVLQSQGHAISAMDEFRRFVAAELSSFSVTYVLNKSGDSSRDIALKKSFRTQIGESPGFILPRDSAVLDRAQGRYSTLNEVGPRTPLRKAIRELSIYLDEFI